MATSRAQRSGALQALERGRMGGQSWKGRTPARPHALGDGASVKYLRYSRQDNKLKDCATRRTRAVWARRWGPITVECLPHMDRAGIPSFDRLGDTEPGARQDKGSGSGPNGQMHHRIYGGERKTDPVECLKSPFLGAKSGLKVA